MTRTPRPWPPNIRPTDEQMADWLVRCTPQERVEWVSGVKAAADRGHHCFMADHERTLARLDFTPGKGRHRRDDW